MEETQKILALSDEEWTNLDADLKEKMHLAVSSLSEDLSELKKNLDSSKNGE